MKWRLVIGILLGLLIVGTSQVTAYNYWHVGPVSASGSHGKEYIVISGSDPIQGDGYDPYQTIIVSSSTPTEDQKLCLLSGGCYIPKNKRISLKAEPLSEDAAKAYIAFELVEIDTNNGNEESVYQQLLDFATNLLWNAIEDTVPGSWIAKSLVESFKDVSSHPFIQQYGQNNIHEGIGDVTTGGAIFRVIVQNRDRLGPGTYYYEIIATSTTDIYYYSHQSWIFGIKNPKEIEKSYPVKPLDYSYKVESVSVSIEYALKYVKKQQ
ncbi:hypothetical protein [Thermococcus sp.]